MSETLISPGVSAIENDQTFISQQPIQAGAALVGPTVKGKVGIPTIVTSYSDFINKYGSTFKSGSAEYSYLTSISAYNYFQNGGNSLLVTRVVSGSFTSATSSIPTSTALTSASVSLNLTFISESVENSGFGNFNINGINIYFTGSSESNTNNTIYINTSSFADSTIDDYLVTSSFIFNSSSSQSPYTSPLSNIVSSISFPSSLIFTYTGSNGLLGNNQYLISGSTTTYFTGGTNTIAFTLETITEGTLMNNDDPEVTGGALPSGSDNNIRWQILSPDIDNGTFTLLIRRGNDESNFPVVLENWTNLSLDPKAPNYIEKAIGNQTETIQQDGTDYYVNFLGEYSNRSSYIRIKSVSTKTYEYFDNNGVPKNEYTGSIPTPISGAFGGAVGNNLPSNQAGNYYNNINNNNTQGLQADDYNTTITLLSNKDNYQYNFITTPGLIYDPINTPSHISTISTLVTNCQSRGDTMAIIDMANKGATLNSILENAKGINSSYAATYWPWTRIIDPNTGQRTWTPPSTLIPGVYVFNDRAAAPWFAPAGTTRGIISEAIETERILPKTSRDALYKVNINPINNIPGTGVVIFGQKTLQKKKSALDRVNVRRLLIELKSFITQISTNLLFEQNTQATRNDFLNQVNPYLSDVQRREGLTSFRVVMDETNNTPEVIDNNELRGQIYLQPVRSVEFIYLDFNLTQTGVSFE
jgi:hypothetical protein